MHIDMDMLHSDVLIIGGGAAALSAACSASENESRVIVIEAGRPGRSGSSATAGGGTAAAFGHTVLGVVGNQDTPEVHFNDTLQAGHGINNPKLARILVSEIIPIVRKLTNSGVPYVQTAEKLFYQNRGVGQSFARNCTPRGNSAALCEFLMKTAAYRGVIFIDNLRVIRLIKDNGKIIGAIAMHIATGTFLTVYAASIILASGSATSLMPYASAAFPTWGDSFRLAWEAGATLGNMEFIEFTFAPMNGTRVFSCGGSTQLVSRGARFFNRLGEAFLENNPSIPSSPTRSDLVPAFYREIKEGRGPVYLDCASIPASRWNEWESIGHPLIALLRSLHGDSYQSKTLSFTPALHCILGGICIDEYGRTSIPGLFAAGEASTGLHGASRLGGNAIAECLVFGSRSGKAAAENITTTNEKSMSSSDLLSDIIGSDHSAPLSSLLSRLRTVAWESLGVVRTKDNLEQGLSQFQEIYETASASRAQTPQDINTLMTLRALSLTAILTGQAALMRKESRGCHVRGDIPKEENLRYEKEWRVNLLFSRETKFIPQLTPVQSL